MKNLRLLLPAALLALSASAALAHDLKTDTFQVTGEVTKMDDNSITVVKGKERHHITRDKDTKVTGEVKVGSKVEIHYRMYAASIEAKEAKAAPAKKKK